MATLFLKLTMAGAKPGVHLVQLRPISVSQSLIVGNKFIMFSDVSIFVL